MKINELLNDDWWNPFKKKDKDTYPQPARAAMDAAVAKATADNATGTRLPFPSD